MTQFSTLISLCFLVSAGACSALPGTFSSKTPTTAIPQTAPKTEKAPSSASTQEDKVPMPKEESGQARRANGEEHKAYHEMVRPHRFVLQQIYEVKKGKLLIPPKVAQAESYLAKLESGIAALSSFAAECGRYSSLKITNLQPSAEPDVACTNANDNKEIVATLAKYGVKRYVERTLEWMEYPIEILNRGDGLSNKSIQKLLTFDLDAERARVQTALAPLLQRSGGTLDLKMLIPDLSAKRALALQEAPRHSKKWRYTKATSGAITKATKKPFAGMREFKLMRTLAAGDWFIHKHRNGITSHRKQRTQVVGRKAKESFCRLYEVELQQSYVGAGAWAKRIRSVAVGDIRITTCR